jgi:hypothetical protein
MDDVAMCMANETDACYLSKEAAFQDRRLFVRNLGVFFRQTRDGVESMELSDDEVVTITYRGGGTHSVNVHMDSYAAIVRDVAKNVT